MSGLPGRKSQQPEHPLPPPFPPLAPPPLPPQRYTNRATSALARIAQPFLGSCPPSPTIRAAEAFSGNVGRTSDTPSLPSSGPSQTVSHKTGIPIASLDISPQRTHAVVAGREIFKTIRVSPDSCAEEFNIRAAIISYSSTHNVISTAIPARHKDQLAANDVKWSHGQYDTVIATAAANGRIVIYDLNRAGLELARFREHNRQVHKLAFNPYKGAWLLSGSQDASICMWDLRMVSGERSAMNFGSKNRFDGHNDAVRDVRWSPVDGVEFAAATDSGVVQHWDVRKHSAPLMKINAHERTCFCVDWHPDGKHLLSGGADNQVKVWDFSTADRKQKPCFQLRTPQYAVNARWRPPSLMEAHKTNSGAAGWETTQIVTSYDPDDPRVHLWDFRRPHIPYKEFNMFNRERSDLLWHSNDLLWTVGPEGAFTQTDVRYTPQIIDQRRPCAAAWSPNGDIVVFGQKRPRRRGLERNYGLTEFISREKANERNDKLPDDALEDPALLPAAKKRGLRASQGRHVKSLGASPEDATPQVLSLEKAMPKAPLMHGQQNGAIGRIPGATFDPSVFRYFAKNYSKFLEPADSMAVTDPIERLKAELDNNAMHAENVSLYRLAQTWRIIKYVVERGAITLPEDGTKADSGGRGKMQSSVGVASQPDLGKGLSRPPLGTKRPSTEKGISAPMTTDNKPAGVAGVIGSAIGGQSMLSSALPGSLLSRGAGSLQSRGRRMEDTKEDAQGPTRRNQENWQSSCHVIDEESISPRSLSPESLTRSRGQLPGNYDEQRSAPRAIAGRPGSHQAEGMIGLDDPESSEAGFEVDRSSFAGSPNVAKMMLSRSANSQNSRLPRPKARQDSDDSLRMFSTSNESSLPNKSLMDDPDSPELSNLRDEYPTTIAHPLRRGSLGSLGNDMQQGEQELEIGSPPELFHHRMDPSPEEPWYSEGSANGDDMHLIRPSSPLPFLVDSQPKEKQPVPPQEAGNKTVRELATPADSPPSTIEAEAKPWSAQNLLKKAIEYYCTTSPADIQSAAHFLHKLHNLFASCDKYLDYQQRELIFKSYNELLQRQQMFINAAEVRLLCVGEYPSVYEYAQNETFINVYCFTCKKPYENPYRDNQRCHRCQTPQLPCTICESFEPPREWVEEYISFNNPLKLGGGNNIITRPHGTSLWSWCQGCGHGAHTACQVAWLSDVALSEGGCATPGCRHDCGPGPRREEYRTAAAQKARGGRAGYVSTDRGSTGSGTGVFGPTKRDSWAAGESKAVERVRKMLGVAPGSGHQQLAATNSSEATESSHGGAGLGSKKVRVVSPG